MNEEEGYIAAALTGLLNGKYHDGTTSMNDEAVRWYAAIAVKVGKATMYAHTTKVVPVIPPVVPASNK